MVTPRVHTRARRMQPDERRQLIMTAACGLGLEHGLNAISRRTLAARLEITPALIGYYTTSMEDLVAETFSSISARELQEITEIAEHQPTPSRALVAVLSTMLDGKRDAVTAIWADGWSIGRRSVPLAHAVHEQMLAWERLLSGILCRGGAAGEFVCADPSRLAHATLGLVDGLNAQALVRRRTHAGGRAETDDRLDVVLRMISHELNIQLRI
jgi:AcrR family transcriptional regulator